MIKLLRRVVRKIFFFSFQNSLIILDFFFPKRNDFIVFGSNGGNIPTGNSLSLFEYLLNVKDIQSKFFLRKQCYDDRMISFYSFKDILFFLRAKVVILTHGSSDLFPLSFSKRKVVINLFHGVPTKGMGYAQKEITNSSLKNGKQGKQFNFLLCSSKIAAHNMNYCLSGDRITYLLCGQPRNDRFVNGKNKPHIKQSMLKKDFDKVILYAPTWREYGPTEWFSFDDANLDELNQLLVLNKSIIYLRPHVNEKFEDIGKNLRSNIKLLDYLQCPDVYDLLLDVDCLITDYSSIYNDFILMDRPVIFIHYDITRYLRYNSLMLDDIDFWYPGEKPESFKHLIFVLSRILDSGNDGFELQRSLVNRLLHSYENGKACEKITSFLKKGDFSSRQREIEL